MLPSHQLGGMREPSLAPASVLWGFRESLGSRGCCACPAPGSQIQVSPAGRCLAPTSHHTGDPPGSSHPAVPRHHLRLPVEGPAPPTPSEVL